MNRRQRGGERSRRIDHGRYAGAACTTENNVAAVHSAFPTARWVLQTSYGAPPSRGAVLLPGASELVNGPARRAPGLGVERRAAVDQQGVGGSAHESLRVGLPVLGPLGGQDDEVGTVEGAGQVVGVVELGVADRRGGHGLRVVNGDDGTGLLEGLRESESRALADVVGAGLERRTCGPDGARITLDGFTSR